MTNSSKLHGVFNILPTPFDAAGSLDVTSLVTLTNYVIDTGVNGLTILGVMGEASKLSDAERERVIAMVIEATAGRVPVCVGTTHAGTDVCVQYSRRAQELGAAALMVAPPKLARSSDEALRRHYLAVADAVSIPIVIQDHPPSSNVFMSVEFLARIGDEAPHCRFVKLEDEPSPPKISRLLAANPQVTIFGGSGGMMFLEELRRSAVGVMTGFGCPEILVEIYRRFVSGDADGAAEVFYRACPLIRFENQQGLSLAIRKTIYQWRGAMASAHARAPSAALDDGTLADLRDLLVRLGLLRV